MGEVNLVAVLAATVAMFVVGGVWYGFIFGKQWGAIHGFDKLSKAKQKEMQSKMAVPYLGQFIVTALTAYTLAYFMDITTISNGALAFWAWLGFMIPTLYAAITFGGAPEGATMQKFNISAGGTLAPILTGVWVLNLFN